MTDKKDHLQMIQNIVDRQSQNSFQLKSWSVVLVSSLFALSASNSNSAFIYLAYFPIFVFWLLDSYYLHQERLFRALYDFVRKRNESDINFSMNTEPVKHIASSRKKAFFSFTVLLFYLTILISITIVVIIISIL